MPPQSIGGRFFGRVAELKAIAKSFKSGRHVALSGMTGVGKSQLAAEFVKNSKRKGFWTSGGDSPAQTMIALARHLGIEQREKSDDEVLFQTRQRLQAIPGKTLWVIDNLTDLDQLNGLLPQTGKVSLLVTSQDSRESVVRENVDFQPIGVLQAEPAIRLLCRNRRHDRNRPVFLELVDEVGRLPRAVEALAVQLDFPGETPERLLDELRTAPNPLELDRFQTQTTGLQIPQTESMFNALRGPIDALQDNVRGALAPLGYTADLPIPMPLVETLTGLSGGELVNFFQECLGKSVLFADEWQVKLHPLTAATIAATNLDGSLRSAVERAGARLTTIVDSGYPAASNEFLHYERLWDWASLEIDHEILAPLEFSNSLANAFNSAGRFEAAAGLHQKNLAVMERVLGPEHPDTLASRNNLANAFDRAGRFEEAAGLNQENLQVRQRVLGPEHSDTLASQNNLAEAYRSAGRFVEAANLHQETLEVRRRVFGPEHPDTLGSRNNLAIALSGAGLFERAAGLHQETMEVRQRVFGPEHPDTLVSRNNLAIAYHRAGRFEEAAGLHQETLEVRQRVLGPEHPDTLTSRNNLAAAYQSTGRFEEAAGLHQETLEVRQRVLGPEHPDTLGSRNNLAAAFGGSGRHDDVIPLFQENFSIQQRVLGPEHPAALTSRHNLATAYSNTEQYKQSARIHSENLEACERVLGPDHPDTQASRNELAEVYHALGKDSEADALFE